ncbi:MAG: hypothetical protein QXU13_05020 [Desulfurococcaceae archaeon]
MGEEEREKKSRQVIHGVIAGSFLVGLALLFYFHALWPWIIALVGVVVILESIIRYHLS